MNFTIKKCFSVFLNNKIKDTYIAGGTSYDNIMGIIIIFDIFDQTIVETLITS